MTVTPKGGRAGAWLSRTAPAVAPAAALIMVLRLPLPGSASLDVVMMRALLLRCRAFGFFGKPVAQQGEDAELEHSAAEL